MSSPAASGNLTIMPSFMVRSLPGRWRRIASRDDPRVAVGCTPISPGGARSMFPARLVSGYRAFLGDRFVRERRRYEALGGTQSPDMMVIGCCDSRVSPEIIFDASPGEIFVVRNVANLVPPYETDGHYHGTSAALEFAVQALRIKHIVVLGHARCGGIRAFADEGAPLSPGDFIGQWMSLIASAAARVERADDPDDYLRRLE